MKSPAISVLMTVFNAGGFLKLSVESILRQSWKDFEFVIVDDASTDGSVKALKNFAAGDRRIRLICNAQNSGQTACLNQGLAECRGGWVARQDADDLSAPDRLSSQWRAIGKQPDLVLLGVNGWVINESGGEAGMIHAPLSDKGIRWSMPFRNPFIHTGVMFRRCHPDGSPVAYNPSFRICQDWELWSRLADDGRVANLNNRLVFYRHSSSSLSNQFSTRTREENRLVVADIWSRHFPTHPLSAEEADLLEKFREGLPRESAKMWRSFYRRARQEWLAGPPARNPEGQAEAVHWLQAAGALARQSRLAAAAATAQAISADPAWTLQTLWQRQFPAGVARQGQLCLL